jgi:hypothetical protein
MACTEPHPVSFSGATGRRADGIIYDFGSPKRHVSVTMSPSKFEFTS